MSSAKIKTISIYGVNIIDIEVQISINVGLPSFIIVGLPSKSIEEAKERIRSSLAFFGKDLPAKRIVVNLSPADVHKSGSYYDLPIAICLLAAMEVVKCDFLDKFICIGELSLFGDLIRVNRAFLAGLRAAELGLMTISSLQDFDQIKLSGTGKAIFGATLEEVINNINSQRFTELKIFGDTTDEFRSLSFEWSGNRLAKRALEIAIAGWHHLLMIGPPGIGKTTIANSSMCIMPPLSEVESREISKIASIVNTSCNSVSDKRPFRNPHYSCTNAAMLGGGPHIEPGEITLAHKGVLFLDELPEFDRGVLDALKGPLESGIIMISRLNHKMVFPCDFLMIAAMNPCRCGVKTVRDCRGGRNCAMSYGRKISEPIKQRIGIVINLDQDFDSTQCVENSADVISRIMIARSSQYKRGCLNGRLPMKLLTKTMETFSQEARQLIAGANKFESFRAYEHTSKIARTIADLTNSEMVLKEHVGEALMYVHRS